MRAAFIAALILVGGLILGLALATTTLDGVDNGLNDALAAFRARPLLHATVWITGLGASPAIFAVVLVSSAFLFASNRRFEIGALWIVWAGAELTSWTLKSLVARARPTFLDVASASSFSFPSGHTTMSMAIYGFLAWLIAQQMPTGQRRLIWALAGLLILAVGASRIFLSVHYLTDVLGGLAIGFIWCLIGIAVSARKQ